MIFQKFNLPFLHLHNYLKFEEGQYDSDSTFSRMI